MVVLNYYSIMVTSHVKSCNFLPFKNSSTLCEVERRPICTSAKMWPVFFFVLTKNRNKSIYVLDKLIKDWYND